MLDFHYFINLLYSETELALLIMVLVCATSTFSLTYFIMRAKSNTVINLNREAFELEKQNLVKEMNFIKKNSEQLEFEKIKFCDEMQIVKNNLTRIQTMNEMNTAKNLEITERLASELEKKVKLENDYLESQKSLSSYSVQNETLQSNLKLINESLLHQFKNIANEVLVEQSAKFSQHSKEKMDTVLNPLNQKLNEFQKTVKECFDIDAKEKFSLKDVILRVIHSNDQIKSETSKLSNALKSNNMILGHWGEMILENVLNASGLRLGQDYNLQEKIGSSSLRPDAVVYLPNKKSIIIDAKTSYFNSEDFNNLHTDSEKNNFIKDFIKRVRLQIDSLASKEYHYGSNINTIELTVMFVPVESWYNLAIQHDSDLYEYAWKKNIVMVSASMLFVILKTVAYIWKGEDQDKNVSKIAEAAGGLHDQFVDFVSILTDFNKTISSLNCGYERVLSKLCTGNGNLIKRMKYIQSLGAKNKKNLDIQAISDIYDEAKSLANQSQVHISPNNSYKFDEVNC